MIITKVGLVHATGRGLLVVRKKKGGSWILPGGKPEPEDVDEAHTLLREVREELGCEVNPATMRYMGRVSGPAADRPGDEVALILFTGELVGVPRPCAEIGELRWHRHGDAVDDLAPTIRDHVLPALYGDQK